MRRVVKTAAIGADGMADLVNSAHRLIDGCKAVARVLVLAPTIETERQLAEAMIELRAAILNASTVTYDGQPSKGVFYSEAGVWWAFADLEECNREVKEAFKAIQAKRKGDISWDEAQKELRAVSKAVSMLFDFLAFEYAHRHQVDRETSLVKVQYLRDCRLLGQDPVIDAREDEVKESSQNQAEWVTAKEIAKLYDIGERQVRIVFGEAKIPYQEINAKGEKAYLKEAALKIVKAKRWKLLDSSKSNPIGGTFEIPQQ